MRLALNTAALIVLAKQWPGVEYRAAGLRRILRRRKIFRVARGIVCQAESATSSGLYLAGINDSTLVDAAQSFDVFDDKFKRIPVFLQSGTSDKGRDGGRSPEDRLEAA